MSPRPSDYTSCWTKKITSHLTSPCSMSKSRKCRIVPRVSRPVSPLRIRVRDTEPLGKTSKLHFEKESVLNTTQVTLSKSISRKSLDTDSSAERGERRQGQHVPQRLTSTLLPAAAGEMLFLPCFSSLREKRVSEFRLYPNLCLLVARDNNIFLLSGAKLPISICPFPVS